MKTLQLSQLENLEGGNPCNNEQTFMNGLSGAGIIFTAAEIFACATPIGWVCLGIGAITFAYGISHC